MSAVTYVACDNPKCKSIGRPEFIDEKDHSHTPPYGWVTATVSWFGCGPTVTVEVCKIKCLPSAIDNAEQDERERENR